MCVLRTSTLKPDSQACLNTRVRRAQGPQELLAAHSHPCGLPALGGPRHGGPRLPGDGSAWPTPLCRSGPSGPLSTRTLASLELTDSACTVLRAFRWGLSSDGAQRSPSEPAHPSLGHGRRPKERNSTCHVRMNRS